MRITGPYAVHIYGVIVLGWLVVFLPGGCSGQTSADSATIGKKAEAAEDVESLLSRGSLQMAAGRWEEAVSDLTRAYAAAADNREVAFKLGAALLQTESYRKALAILEPLEEENPTASSLLNNIAWACIKATDPAIRNIEKGLKYVRRALLEDQDDPAIWGTLAEAHHAAGNYREAFRASRIAMWAAIRARSANMWEFTELARRCSADAAGAL